MSENETIRVLVVEPGKMPYERKISTLEEMQEIVGGHIEAVTPFPEPVALVVNESGKILDLSCNRAIMDESGLLPVDVIQGTFFVAGIDGEDFISLTDEQVQRYTELYSSQAVLTVDSAQREAEPVQQTDAPSYAGPVDVMGVFAFPDPDKKNWNIRFVDTDYNTLFTIPDGASITLTRFDGQEETFPCRYIDDTHFEAYQSVYHIYQFAEMMERNGNICRPEHPQPGDVLDTYEIYQLKDSRDTDYGFMPYDYAKGKIRPEHYRRAYAGVLAPKVTLEDLYRKHNQGSRPFGSRMQSLSMSDVVVLNRDGKRQAFYVDRVGFAECGEFLKPPRRTRTSRKRKNPER